MNLPFLDTPTKRLPDAILRRFILGAVATVSFLAPLTAGADRFDLLWEQDRRVAAVAYRLSLAGAVLCRSATGSQSGIELHNAAQFGADDEAARRVGDGPTVLSVVAGSAPDRAGLSVQDTVLAIDGVATDGSIDAAKALLADALGRGMATLLVARQEGRREVRFRAPSGCPTRVEVLTEAPSDQMRPQVTGAG